ncbi:hypothetical protein TCDM_00822 [Trypanosoma cruzi Dm28c]|uniref:Transmembrane protein n=1 Tax=Trypanosoma cruzi Dm28c TaxID=1416333 RepID=V5C0M4_TRYCR|nr:hypothetical protein TCDM_00822 [Trypanosoma cruzi Dm28c]
MKNNKLLNSPPLRAGGARGPSRSLSLNHSRLPASSPRRTTKKLTSVAPGTTSPDPESIQHVNELAIFQAYKKNWCEVILGSTSGLLFLMVLAVLYAVYTLCLPYGDSISFGILLSVVLHPKSTVEYFGSRYEMRCCAERMRKLQQAWASRSGLSGVIGSLLSLGYFFSCASMQGVMFLGLDKLSVSARWGRRGGDRTGKARNEAGEEREFLTSTPTGRAILRLLVVTIFTVVAHSTIGIFFFFELHAVLMAVFAVTVVIVPEERFTSVMWRLWCFALALFFVVALSYNMAVDVLSISDAVKRTTSAVVNARKEWSHQKTYSSNLNNISVHDTDANATSFIFSSSGIEEMIMTKLQETVLKEIDDTLRHTNATELAVAVRQVIGPMLTTFPSEISIGSLKNKSKELYASLFRRGDPLLTVDWLSVLQKLLRRWRPFFAFLTQLLFGLGSNMMGLFDSVYATMLFVCVLRYFLQLEHTILYYGFAKMLRVIHPQGGEKHARMIEREITVSFRTLLQSFWHLSWFHFCITFCLFNAWSFPTPFFCGMISSLTAVFPLTPKWFSPVAFALGSVFFNAVASDGFLGAAVDQRVWSCFLAFLASYADEWLLCVSRGLRGNPLKDFTGVKREQLPTFVVGTALVLGYVTYGVRGILLGPMTVIVAKVLFDNWDIVSHPESLHSRFLFAEETESA